MLGYSPWDAVFYMWAIICVVWFIIFVSIRILNECSIKNTIDIMVFLVFHVFQMLVCYNDPESDPFISKKEKDYLLATLGQLKRKTDLPSTPWKSIFTSPPVLVLILGQVHFYYKFTIKLPI